MIRRLFLSHELKLMWPAFVNYVLRPIIRILLTVRYTVKQLTVTVVLPKVLFYSIP